MFAIELLIDIGVFSFCAAVCVGLFVHSELVSRNSADLTRSVSIARSAAECWRASGGDLSSVRAQIGGDWEAEASRLTLYYDGDWNPTPAPSVFTLRLETSPGEGFSEAVLTVASEDAELLSWRVAALEGDAERGETGRGGGTA